MYFTHVCNMYMYVGEGSRELVAVQREEWSGERNVGETV